MQQIPATMVESVVHVISDAGPHGYFRTLIEHGLRERSAITVGCVGPPGPLQDDMADLGVRSFALGARSRVEYPLAAVHLARLLHRRRAKIIQTHLVDGSLVGLAAARLARSPVAVMTAHHSHELPFHGPRLRLAERLCVGPLCDRIIAPSRAVAETIFEQTGVPARKIVVVHHGFDLGRLDPQRADGRRVREELGLGESLVFGSIGRLYRLKNQAALVQAFAQISRLAPEARLLLVGAGDSTELRKLAHTLGIGEKLVLSAPRPDIPEVLAACDVFVHPALAESFGMVIIEAMAMAKPVLSTSVGIAPEVIEPPANGLLADGSGAAALAAGLERMLELREHWLEIGVAARRTAERFTAEAMANRYEQLYAGWLEQQIQASAPAGHE